MKDMQHLMKAKQAKYSSLQLQIQFPSRYKKYLGDQLDHALVFAWNPMESNLGLNLRSRSEKARYAELDCSEACCKFTRHHERGG